MATKKKAPTKVVKKVVKAAPKKAAKAVVKKAAPKKAAKPIAKKAAPKKAIAKKVAPQKVAKPVAKKAAPKKVAKAVAKKVAPQKVAKPVAKKATPKKVAPKKVAKPVVKKAAPKKVAKPVAKKVTPQKEAKVVAPKPPKEKKTPKALLKKSVAKPIKKIFTPQGIDTVEKSDVFKTSTFGVTTLKNESGKVLAHRNTSDLKRKSKDELKDKKYEPIPTRSILDMSTANTGISYRYSDEDLKEFKELILRKLDTAKAELQYLQSVIMRKDDGGTDDTENKYQNIEEGSMSMEREQFNQLASRQITFISHLEQALVRIENKTYGICRVTGKLIDKARLRAVPHATLSIEAKNAKK
ncbi:MAG: TraR/DksA C4-type zinc finger protein [Chitinophagaceae bacterium]